MSASVLLLILIIPVARELRLRKLNTKPETLIA